jgi:hypothetical protein
MKGKYFECKSALSVEIVSKEIFSFHSEVEK